VGVGTLQKWMNSAISFKIPRNKCKIVNSHGRRSSKKPSEKQHFIKKKRELILTKSNKKLM
jgi:hypothetical protein